MGTSRRVGVGTGYHQASEVGTVLSPRGRLVYSTSRYVYIIFLLLYMRIFDRIF
jgi:hypothetical protein